jgi:transcriptional regulator with XRE-family HTH domain
MARNVDRLTPLGRAIHDFKRKHRYGWKHVIEITGLSKSQIWELETQTDANPTLSTLIAISKFMKKQVGFIANLAAEPKREGE